TSGTVINEEGNYTLVVTDAAGNAETVCVVIERPDSGSMGVDYGASYNTEVAPAFNEGTATLNGEPFTSGTVINEEGNYTLVVTDAAGNADTVSFAIDKTVPEVTGGEDRASYTTQVPRAYNGGSATLKSEPFS